MSDQELNFHEPTEEEERVAKELRGFLRAHAARIGRKEDAELYIGEAEHLEGTSYWSQYFPSDTAKEELVADFDLFLMHVDGPLFSSETGSEIAMQPVVSSTIKAVGYSARSQILRVEFKSGVVYRYSDVPQEIFDGLMAAPSHGAYFAHAIRKRPELYPHKKEETRSRDDAPDITTGGVE